jgi:soluble lytic murein transglycosylase-like protein
MTLLQNCKSSGQNTDHSSSVPAKTCTAVARSVGPGRRSSRRASASPLTAAGTMSAFRSLGTMLCIVVILAASMLSSGTAHAEQESSATRRPNELSVRPFAAFVTEASKRFGVPEHWIRAVMHVESSARQQARSSKGAMGLMQITPKTWSELRARYRLGDDPYDPRDNIMAGAAYIRELYDRYGAPGFLAAYNAGPGTSHDGGSPIDMRQNHSSRAHGVVDLSALVPHSGNLFVHRASEMRSR